MKDGSCDITKEMSKTLNKNFRFLVLMSQKQLMKHFFSQGHLQAQIEIC